MKLPSVTAPLLTLALVAGACSSDSTVVTGATSQPNTSRSTTTVEAATTSITAATAVEAGTGSSTTLPGLGLPPGSIFAMNVDQPDVPVLVIYRSTGGFTTIDFAFSQSADYAVYPNGVVRALVSGFDEPARYEQLALDQPALAMALDRAAEAGVLDAQADFGVPNIADAGAAVMTINEAGPGPRTIAAEALGLGIDGIEGIDGPFTAEQIRLRNELSALIEFVETAVGDPVASEAAGPDRWIARAVSDDGDRDANPWPLDAELLPELNGCVELTPAEYAQLRPTVAEAGGLITGWSRGEIGQNLVFAARFPTENGCP